MSTIDKVMQFAERRKQEQTRTPKEKAKRRQAPSQEFKKRIKKPFSSI